MTSGTLNATWLDYSADAAIEAYQRHLSPWKGFRCAHAVLHRGRSCSEFARRVVLRGGAAEMTRLLSRRFDRCATAAAVLRSRRGPDYAASRRHDSKRPTLAESCGDAIVSSPLECTTELACEACAAAI